MRIDEQNRETAGPLGESFDAPTLRSRNRLDATTHSRAAVEDGQASRSQSVASLTVRRYAMDMALLESQGIAGVLAPGSGMADIVDLMREVVTA
jgi:hypothetical protein